MTRDEVLHEFYPPDEWADYDPMSVMEAMADEIVRLRDERESVSSQLHDAENERDGLRSRLATVEAEREHAYAVAQQNEATTRKLNAILTALREPSAAVVEEAAKALYLRGDLSQWCTWEHEIARYKETYYEDALPIIRAVVAAAERETLIETSHD